MKIMPGKLALLFLLVLCLFPRSGFSAQTYNIDFSDVDLKQVIELVSEITGKNFLVDERVQGRVTVIGPKSLTGPEIYQVFLSVLQAKGFAVVPSGKINKIIPVANIPTSGVEIKVGEVKDFSYLDHYVTHIIPVKYTGAEDLKNLLTPLIPKTDSIISYGPTNLLILTTTESVFSRLSEIINLVDVPGAAEEVRIIEVQYASVAELADKITQVIQTQAGVSAARRAPRGQAPQETSSTQVKIIPDDRTNSLIAIGDMQTLDRIEDLVRRLDVSVPRGSGKIHVYYLQNSDAAELAAVLTGIPLQESVADVQGTPEQPTPRPAPRATAPKSEISIIADDATNALVITATAAEFEALKDIIQKLDIPREQVLVEVLIAEISFSKTMQLGVEWRIGDDYNGDAAVYGGTSFGEFNQLALSFPTLPSGLVVGAIGETITFGDYEFPSLGALIRALRTDSDVNILSTPTIVTTDNKEAEIIVGQTVPFQTSQKFDANNQPIYTYDYRDVGLTLKLTPQINSDRYVKMDIFSKLEALVSGTSGTSDLAPTTLKRQANTTVVVKDGHTVVIGGLIRDDKTRSVSRVPLLGSLPLLGPLFRNESTTSEKTNLLIFMTPRVISGSEELQAIGRRRLEKFGEIPQEFMERMQVGEEDLDTGAEEETQTLQEEVR